MTDPTRYFSRLWPTAGSPSGWPAVACAWIAALVVLLVPERAWADRVILQVRGARFEVGDPVQVQLSVTSDLGEMPQSPRLTAPAGFNVRGPSISTQTQMTISGGQVQQSQGIQATWILSGRQVGRFRIGPANVMIGGHRTVSNTVEIELVAAGQGGGSSGPGQRRGGRGRGPGQPFDPFGMMDPADPGFPSFPFFPGFPGGGPGGIPGRIPDLFDDEAPAPDAPEALPPYPDELKVSTAKDPIAFLRAEISPKTAVVGEQVTYRVYAYARAQDLEDGPATEPSTTDFVKHSIMEISRGEPSYRIPLGGAIWRAKKVREIALFPIRSGRLQVGAMKMVFASSDGRVYQHQGKILERTSLPVEVLVTEPPPEGRPAAYQIGDVGSFTLSAEVQPRQAQVGDSVSVVVKLEGTGNLPLRLKPPTQNGTEWMDPTVTSSIEPKSGRVAGSRRFSYLVRMTEPGKKNLGDFEFPYWDPTAKAYRVAKARLGVIDVKGQSAPAAEANPASKVVEDRLGNLGAPRQVLGEGPAARSVLGDQPWFWLLLLGAPLSVVGARGAKRGIQSLHHWAKARSGSLRARRQRAFSDARVALQNSDAALAANCAERGLFLAIEEATGLLARGLLRNELRERLNSLGVETSLVVRLVEALEALDGVRFQGDAGTPIAEQVNRAESLSAELERGRRGGKKPS